MRIYIFLIALMTVLSTVPALAQTGPVATACKDEIAKFCADVPHDGSVRACLEREKDKVSKKCRHALDTTGGGKGRHRGGNG